MISSAESVVIVRFVSGTNGGVSIAGTLASVLGGSVVGLGYYACLLLVMPDEKLVYCPPQWPIVIICALSGLVGSTIDSILGSTIQFSGLYPPLHFPCTAQAEYLVFAKQ